jgi:hypothetical protein
VLVDPATGTIQALLPFTGFAGPAALTFNGTTPDGGIFGTEALPLRVDVPGAFVVTPNSSRSFPTVWLTGDPTRAPHYQFANDVTHREVVFISRPVPVTDPQQTNELLRRQREELFDETTEDAISTATGLARTPEPCTAVQGDTDSALACAQAKPR